MMMVRELSIRSILSFYGGINQYLGQQTWMNPQKELWSEVLGLSDVLLEKKTLPTNLPLSLASIYTLSLV